MSFPEKEIKEGNRVVMFLLSIDANCKDFHGHVHVEHFEGVLSFTYSSFCFCCSFLKIFVRGASDVAFRYIISFPMKSK